MLSNGERKVAAGDKGHHRRLNLRFAVSSGKSFFQRFVESSVSCIVVAFDYFFDTLLMNLEVCVRDEYLQ